MFHYCLNGDTEGVKKCITNVENINWRNEDLEERVEYIQVSEISKLLCVKLSILF